MARYLAVQLYEHLLDLGCEYDGDRTTVVTGWFSPDQIPFTLPAPVDGWLDADVIDLILSDRWVWTGPIRLTRYPD